MTTIAEGWEQLKEKSIARGVTIDGSHEALFYAGAASVVELCLCGISMDAVAVELLGFATGVQRKQQERLDALQGH